MTDPEKIIASPHSTQPTGQLFDFIKDFVKKEVIESIVVGMPRDLKGKETNATQHVVGFIRKLRKEGITVHEHDEKFTSKMALQTMIEGGTTKKQRREKETIDKVSAAIILQSFMEKEKYTS